MKAWIQRVTEASVEIDGEIVSQIGLGYLVLLGVTHSDTEKTADEIADRICKLRIFEDENGKTNLSIRDVNGSLLIVSQFTLYADCSHGNRPSFTGSAPAALAEELYEYFVECCRKEIPCLEHGSFGADMKVTLENDGPFTVMLE